MLGSAPWVPAGALGAHPLAPLPPTAATKLRPGRVPSGEAVTPLPLAELSATGSGDGLTLALSSLQSSMRRSLGAIGWAQTGGRINILNTCSCRDMP